MTGENLEEKLHLILNAKNFEDNDDITNPLDFEPIQPTIAENENAAQRD